MLRSLVLALALVLSAGVLAQSASPDDKRKLVEQKMKLLEMLVNSPSAKASPGKGDAPSLAEKGGKALELARGAVAESRFDEAAQILDDALRSSSSSARRGGPDPSLSESALRLAHQNLVEQVATYRASVEDLVGEPKIGAAAKGLLARIDAQSAAARKEVGAGRLDAANRILGDAYKLAVTELSRLRAGHEVVMSLNFASPADEYAYEIKRFESGELMVGMLIGEGKADGDRRALVDGFAAEGRRLRGEAQRLAQSGQHKEAVGLMEKATAQMNRALQAMGVPVF